MNLPPLRAPQERAIAHIKGLTEQGEKLICLVAPTGGGKTRIAIELTNDFIDRDRKVLVLTNRKLLIEQLVGVFSAAGVEPGVRAANYPLDHTKAIQIASIQTETSRTVKGKIWDWFDADLVIIDEAHLNSSASVQKIIARYLEHGSVIVGMTATPIDLGHIYRVMVEAGTKAELRELGALVPCRHIGCDEPDKRLIRTIDAEDLSENELRDIFGKAEASIGNKRLKQLCGRVFDWYDRLNPERSATILFAPGVNESIWFHEEFVKRGISAAHIDGETVWLNGKPYNTSPEMRAEVLELSRLGEVKVLCNRFVLREGIDAPWLAHGIFATIFGSLQSYLQSGGRLLRAFPGLKHVTLQDHGGNWWRHGSLNEDREWKLDWTAAMYTGVRRERLEQGEEKEPVRCPQCGLILKSMKCVCGFVIQRASRPVVMANGELAEHTGRIFRPRTRTMKKDTTYLWKVETIKGLKGKKTYRQCEANFFRLHGYYPPRGLPLMPSERLDWYLKVSDVPQNRLVGAS